MILMRSQNHMRMMLDSEYYFNASLTDLSWFYRLHIRECAPARCTKHTTSS